MKKNRKIRILDLCLPVCNGTRHKVQQLSFRTEFLNLEQTTLGMRATKVPLWTNAAELSSSSTCESKYCSLSTSLTDYEPAKLCTRPTFSYTELVIDSTAFQSRFTTASPAYILEVIAQRN